MKILNNTNIAEDIYSILIKYHTYNLKEHEDIQDIAWDIAEFIENKYNNLKIKYEKLQKKINTINDIEYGFKVKQQLKELL